MAEETIQGPRDSIRQLSDVHARLQNLRNLIQSERHSPAEQRRAREAFEQEMDDMAQDNSRSLSARASQLRSHERRRPYVDIPADHQDSSRQGSPVPPLPTGVSPSSLVRNRRRAFRPSERLTRNQRERVMQDMSSAASYGNGARPTSPLPEPPDPYTARDYRSRAKRRKLDDGSYENEVKAISYGYKGQVVPGQLKLEIASCDGGEYQDPHIPMNSWPQNVLQDDATVYCTKSHRCNMLLRHVSSMPFTLTKMVIKAPRSGYDAPIQEGMIFVAMSDEDLLEKTARYEIHYSPKNYRYHRLRLEHHSRPSQDHVNSTRSPLRSIDRTRYLRNPHHVVPQVTEHDPILDSALVPGFDILTGDPSEDEAQPSRPSSPRPWLYNDQDDVYRPYVDRYRPRYPESSTNLEPQDDISNPTSDSDDLADHLADAAEMVAVLNEMGEHGQDARRILRGTRRDAEAAARRIQEDTDSDSSPDPYTHRRPTPSSRTMLRQYGNPEPSHPPGYDRLESEPEAAAAVKPRTDIDTALHSAASSSTMVAPHARFFIPRSKSSVAVKFDPPVAGRYILIKLWAPCPNANIDIQAITAHGYGGPRFFPGVEMR